MTFWFFLRKEAPEKCLKKDKNLKNKNFNDLEIVNGDIFYPKLKQTKEYDKHEYHVQNVIATSFFEKDKDNKLIKKDPLSFVKTRCKVIVNMDITDIFINYTTIKIRTSVSEVLIIKKNVPPPIRTGMDQFTAFSELTFGSDDESETEDDQENVTAL